MSDTTIFTRKDYMAARPEDQAAAHRRYYAQFVTPSVLALVRSRIGESRIRASADPHFNDIPLREWDNLNMPIKDACLSIMGDVNGALSANAYGQRSIAWSLGDAVCIAKEAALQIAESA